MTDANAAAEALWGELGQPKPSETDDYVDFEQELAARLESNGVSDDDVQAALDFVSELAHDADDEQEEEA